MFNTIQTGLFGVMALGVWITRNLLNVRPLHFKILVAPGKNILQQGLERDPKETLVRAENSRWRFLGKFSVIIGRWIVERAKCTTLFSSLLTSLLINFISIEQSSPGFYENMKKWDWKRVLLMDDMRHLRCESSKVLTTWLKMHATLKFYSTPKEKTSRNRDVLRTLAKFSPIAEEWCRISEDSQKLLGVCCDSR